jgi:hypothetical protein
MINALLLLPVFGVLGWLYWYLLPGEQRFTWFDRALFAVLLMAVFVFTTRVSRIEFDHAGPLFGDLMSAVGGYVILAAGLGLGLAWRRRVADCD